MDALKFENAALYWRKAYETLVAQTGRDINDGYGIDPRKAVPSPLARVPAPSAPVEAVAWRPEVVALASLMERQLRANDRKGGWRGVPEYELLKRLREETDELSDALTRRATLTGERLIENVGREAADVANFAMMIADVCGALPVATHPTPPAVERLVEAGEWDTIDTAPKDGTKFVSQDRVNYGRREFKGTHWYVHSSGTGWNTDDLDCGNYEWEPTHWRADKTPAPPAERDFVRQVARLDHTGDEGWTPPEDDLDASNVMDFLIAKAREILAASNTHVEAGGSRVIAGLQEAANGQVAATRAPTTPAVERLVEALRAALLERLEAERKAAAEYPLGDLKAVRHGGIRDGLKEALEALATFQEVGR